MTDIDKVNADIGEIEKDLEGVGKCYIERITSKKKINI